ncbi:MAG TPA: M67 family metallopeptidase [Pyrinomonadaceae bacterium]|nr:M67 family metallopeptidase [Pyrinomonadaceae bacterium]
MLSIRQVHFDEIVAHAREAEPAECCGLIGGTGNSKTTTIYKLRNVARNNEVAYEAAPEDLFTAQRKMRERGEQLLAIYHSHPRSLAPEPSETDVRLAYYPSASYLIISLGGPAPIMRAFHISESEQTWQQVEYEVTG